MKARDLITMLLRAPSLLEAEVMVGGRPLEEAHVVGGGRLPAIDPAILELGAPLSQLSHLTLKAMLDSQFNQCCEYNESWQELLESATEIDEIALANGIVIWDDGMTAVRAAAQFWNRRHPDDQH